MPQSTPEPNDTSALSLLEKFSLEMTARDINELQHADTAIPAGTRVHVTFLAGETQSQRIDAIRALQESGLVAVPHLAARRLSSRAELDAYLDAMEPYAVRDLFVIGGDPSVPEGPFADALSVVESGALEAHGVTSVGIAGYPEGHPDIAQQELWQALEAKVAAARARGLNPFVVTQFGFDVEPVAAWVRAVRGRGITAPLRIGVPGPTSVRRLINYARRFGIGANAMIVKKYGFSLTNLMGTAGPDRFVRELAAQLQRDGVTDGVGVHFYTFGGLAATADWANAAVNR